jgi:hypothetical protein
MRPVALICIVAFSILFVDAANAFPQAQYCALASQGSGFFQRARDPSQRMAFRNNGGLFNKGVCWWHSLYQRAAWHLTVFRPELPKPGPSERKFLVHQIARGKEVIEIPGYKDFFEFSVENRDLIQSKLNQWQLSDGILKFIWIDSLFKPKILPPLNMSTHMRELTDLVTQSGKIHWALWQVPGIVAHASLFLDGFPHHTTTDYSIVDSNYPGATGFLTYIEGASTVITYFGPIVPHHGRHSDLNRFERATRDYCANGPRVHSLAVQRRILEEPLYNGLD